MKIRSRFLLQAIGKLAAIVINIWMRTVKIREHVEYTPIHPRLGNCESFLCCVWHEHIIPTAWNYGPMQHNAVVISNSSDGELMTAAAEAFGWTVIRGSNSKGGIAALQNIIAFIEARPLSRIAFTVDGPRGPRRRIKQGIVYVASRTGMPIICAGIAAERELRAKSWDRMLLPRPFHRIEIYGGQPIRVPPNITKEQVLVYCDIVEREMDRVEHAARSKLGKPMVRERVREEPRKAA